MAYSWAQLLSDLQNSDLSLNIPFTRGITAKSAIKSYQGPVSNNILKSPSMAYLDFSYPTIGSGTIPQGLPNTVLDASILVGFQIEVISGGFSSEQTNPTSNEDTVSSILGQQFQFTPNGRPSSDLPPGTVIFSTSVQLVSDDEDLETAAPLQSYSVLGTTTDITDNVLQIGEVYTARIRAILVCPSSITNFGSLWYEFEDARPFYTEWSTTVFRVNNKPSIINQSINGDSSSLKLPNEDIYFGFTIVNDDGPAFAYQYQISSFSANNFSPDIFDSGLVSDGSGSGTKDYSIRYGGQSLIPGQLYYWRVRSNDGIVNSDWSSIKSFKINNKPRIISIKINNEELIFGGETRATNVSPLLSWTYVDDDSDIQESFTVNLAWEGGTGVSLTGQVSDSSVTLPLLPEDKEINVTLTVNDGFENSQEYIVSFITNTPPRVSDVKIDGQTNPTNLSDTTPSISWNFQDSLDSQSLFRIKVSKDINFDDLVWDTGNVTSSNTFVTYGSTSNPIVTAQPLVHNQGFYYVRVLASDGTTWSPEESSNFSFFAINTRPGKPTLTYPTSGAYSGPLTVRWNLASPIDADNDPVTYTIEITNTRLSNKGWTYIAGPIPGNQSTFVLDLNTLESGDNYGVRVYANDGISDSLISTSDRFTILNHPPFTPDIVSPKSGDVISTKLRVEWIEGFPVDIDNDFVLYNIDLTSNASDDVPVWKRIGTFNEGNTSAIFDVSKENDGNDYKVRITAIDEKGSSGDIKSSEIFEISNKTLATDFERLNGTLYISTSDGKLLEAQESIWQHYQDWNGENDAPVLQTFISGNIKYEIKDGELIITPTNGSSLIFRDKK